MAHGRRGRPPKAEAQKRQQIGVRTSFELKLELEAAADRNGRSVAQEAELRLVRSFDMDKEAGSAETSHLLRTIAAEIALIESRTKKRWFKDLRTWGAVLEMLRQGPFQRFSPDDPVADDVVVQAWLALRETRRKKLALAQLITQNGIPCAASVPSLPIETGLLGLTLKRLELAPRHAERVAIDALDCNDSDKEDLRQALSVLIELDEEEHQADLKLTESLAPYIAAERSGREFYADMRSREAELALRNGNNLYISDLI